MWRHIGKRSPRTVTASIALAGAALMLLPSCNHPGQASGGDGSTVRLAVAGPFSTLQYLPTVLADRLGYFKKRGVDVKLQQLKGGSEGVTAAVSGSSDVISGDYEHTIQAAAEGKDLVAFAKVTRTPVLILAVSPKAHKTINTISDLKGTKVGVSSPGGGTDILLKYLLAKAHVPADAVPVVSVGLGSTAVAAMEQGRIDAAVMLDPAFSQLEKRVPSHHIRTLVDLRRVDQVKKYLGVAEVPAVTLYATPTWLNGHDNDARKITQAQEDALKWISSHSAEQIASHLPQSFAGGDRATYLKALQAAKPSYALNVNMKLPEAKAVQAMMSAGLTETDVSKVNLEKTFTNKYQPTG